MEFEKVLSKNDVGATKSHQAGFLVPKSMRELIDFFPQLNPDELNPSAALLVIDDDMNRWEFRYVYYNNRLHSEKGTRDEYRITCTTKYMRSVGAKEGDVLHFSKTADGLYRLSFVRDCENETVPSNRVNLRGWKQVY